MAMHCSQSVVSNRQIAEEGIAGEDAPSVRGYEGPSLKPRCLLF